MLLPITVVRGNLLLFFLKWQIQILDCFHIFLLLFDKTRDFVYTLHPEHVRLQYVHFVVLGLLRFRFVNFRIFFDVLVIFLLPLHPI